MHAVGKHKLAALARLAPLTQFRKRRADVVARLDHHLGRA